MFGDLRICNPSNALTPKQQNGILIVTFNHKKPLVGASPARGTVWSRGPASVAAEAGSSVLDFE